MNERGRPARCLIVIPCLNEAAHIEGVIDNLGSALNELDARIVVADGGSTDGTRAIVTRIAAENPKVLLLDNPKRIQSAAVNLAVASYGSDCEFLIRIDAHGDYPVDYCQTLMEEALVSGADSVVVGMQTVGIGFFQKATALAQNSKLGNGGSRHRSGAASHWTNHGHHALMRIASFRQVGGYDENFQHNEDAELDYRLVKAGFRIWMTNKTKMVYYPRSSVRPLFRQYFGYGRGRARNFLKHRALPRLRQLIPLGVAPVTLGASFAIINWAAAIPFAIWVGACVSYGVWLGVKERAPHAPLAAVSAMVMHFAWSAGFWREVMSSASRPPLKVVRREPSL